MPMRQLRTCDFCGADAAGIYEVLPPELSPSEAEQRRVVLCEDCRETLEAVVDPLLSRLGIDRATEAAAGEQRSGSPEPVPASPESEEREDEERRERPLDPSATGQSAGATPMTADGDVPSDRSRDEYVVIDGEDDDTHGETTDSADEPAVTEERPNEDYEVKDAAEDADEEPRAHVDASDVPGGDGGDGTADDVESAAEDYEVEDAAEDADEPPRAHVDASDAPGGDAGDDETIDEEEPNADYEVDEPDRKRDSEAENPDEDYEVVDDTDETPASDEVETDSESVGSEPPQFRKVMRLLNNREFPVDRAEFADVASGAYDMNQREVADIIDYAVRRDVLAEDDGQLRKA